MTVDCPSRFVDPDAASLLSLHPGPRRRVLFLDRDGVINVDHGYVHTADGVQWVPGVFELARAAASRGMLLVVVTNQAGIGRGYYSVEQFLEFTGWIHRSFRERGIPLLATYYCPHHPEHALGAYRKPCDCRKPGAGMLSAAAAEFDLDLAASVLVGDKLSDIEASVGAGVGTALLSRKDRLDISIAALGCTV